MRNGFRLIATDGSCGTLGAHELVGVVCLGSLREGGATLRVATAPEAGLAAGQAVTLGIPPEACIVLPPP